jgi:hypothetical protein
MSRQGADPFPPYTASPPSEYSMRDRIVFIVIAVLKQLRKLRWNRIHTS